MNIKLSDQKCVACEGDMTQLLTQEEVVKNLKQIRDWKLDSKALTKDFLFKDFVSAMKFTNSVAGIAEKEGHHPDMTISYDKVKITLSTHAINGISMNDFIVASKIDEVK